MENQFKFTPGPWIMIEIDNRKLTYQFYVKASDGISVTKIARENREPQVDRANAQLIAAAPDLLAFAIDFVEKVESGRAKSTDSYNKAKAAINKATL